MLTSGLINICQAAVSGRMELLFSLSGLGGKSDGHDADEWRRFCYLTIFTPTVATLDFLPRAKKTRQRRLINLFNIEVPQSLFNYFSCSLIDIQCDKNTRENEE